MVAKAPRLGFKKSAAAEKHATIGFPEKYESLLDFFSPDFEMLKGMMRQWRIHLFPGLREWTVGVDTPADHCRV